MTGSRLNFEDFVLDTATRELRRGGTLVALEPQVFDLLAYVVVNRERVVTKDDLIEAVWGGRIVSDSTLTTRINAMRKALGDSGEEQRLIRTVARKGIRFVGAIADEGAAMAQADGPAPTSLSLPDKPSIAVLPFQTMSGEADDDYLADGMVEEIVTALSRFHWLLVIARNSTFIYKGRAVDVKQVSRELGVRYLVEGSVRRSGNRLRVTAQLIDTVTSAHIWAERYDREVADAFKVQDEISESVVASIEPELYAAEDRRSKSKPPASLDAWQLVVRAMSHMNQQSADGTRDAVEMLEKAIDRDPAYARAVALLAWTKLRLAYYGWKGGMEDALRHALELSLRAIALDRDEPWGYLTKGMNEYLRRQYCEGIESMRIALELNPNSAFGRAWFGMLLVSSGRVAEGREELDRALRVSPRDPFRFYFFYWYAEALMAEGRFADAAALARRVVHERPTMVIAYRLLAANAALAGDLLEAQTAVEALRHCQPSISLDWIERHSPLNGSLRATLIRGLQLAGLD